MSLLRLWASNARLKRLLDKAGHLTAAPELFVEIMSPGKKNEKRDRVASLGSLISYELACQLRSRQLPMLIHLYVAAREAPHIPVSPQKSTSYGIATKFKGTTAATLWQAAVLTLPQCGWQPKLSSCACQM